MAKRRGSNDSGTGARGVSLDILNTISRVPSSRAFRVGGPGGLTKSAIGQKTANSPIQFGSPSSRGNIASSTNKSRGGWTGLLGSIGGKGLSDLLGGGVLSSGLDYLVGGFESLFGAGSAPNDTISRFELPDSQNQSIVVNNVKTPAEPRSSGVYGNSKSQISQASKAAIVQTVKNALLTSSSLNDVIGEL